MQQIKLIVLLSIILMFRGCGKQETAVYKTAPKAAVTILPYADFVSKIAGDKIKVEVLVPPGVSPETYDPRPGELSEIQNAGIYFRIGPLFTMENTLLAKLSDSKTGLEIVDCSEGISTVENNPHVWLDPVRVKIIAGNIFAALIKSFPDMKDEFGKRKDKYISSLDSLDKKLQAEFSEFRGRKILTYHPAWGYFTARYGLREISIEKEGKSPSAKDLAELIDYVKTNNIKTIFLEPQFDREIVNSLADQLNLKIVQIDPLPSDFIKNAESVAEKFIESFK